VELLKAGGRFGDLASDILSPYAVILTAAMTVGLGYGLVRGAIGLLG